LGKILGAGGFGQVMAATRKKDNLQVSHFSCGIFLLFIIRSFAGCGGWSSVGGLRIVPENILTKTKDKTGDGLTLKTSAFEFFFFTVTNLP